ncbi:hypothetical protein [Salinicola endophyticus]|uniref:TFIIB-type domain-containing protein n=1 Tax=Salinicola endophyticus TaxID=1949083 RepID=A0AB74U290_9GAMM
MKHDIACHRCGHTQGHSNDAAQDWDEIICVGCGEFIATRDHNATFGSRNHRLHTLSLSVETLLRMAREQPGNASLIGITGEAA